jgi:eukaryotic-like serine/threonine-protein kinase
MLRDSPALEAPRMDPLIGRTLDNKYLIERLLGKGGMGSVYRAMHTGTKRNVAVKVISPQYMRNKELLIRFQREAEASGRLSHPNVVNVTDFGVTAIDGTAVAYLAMEYLEGETLHEFLQKNPLPTPALVLDVLEQVALGVSEAHKHGILHRDLKPQNIWLQPDGRGGFIVKVLDFGIAKLADPSSLAMEFPELEAAPNASTGETPSTMGDDGATLVIAPTELGLTSAFAESSGFATTFGATLGTPAFMSPEQCSGKPVSEKSDLYSLAMMAYLMLVGELPFQGSAKELIEQQITLTPDAPHTRNPRLGEAVSRPILQSLAKDPEWRAPDVRAFAARLRTAVEGEVDLLKESRRAGSLQSGAWFAILFASALPAGLGLMAFRALLRPAIEAKAVPDAVAAAVIFAAHVSLAYLAMVLSDTMMTRWVRVARDGEAGAGEWFRVAWQSYAAGFRCVRAAVWTLHPVRHAIAHIVGTVEGSSAKDSRKRSVALLEGNEPIALALIVRRVTIACLVAGYYPSIMMIMRVPVPIIAREFLMGGFGGSLTLLSFSFLPIYGSFLMAWPSLYERGKRSLGESVAAEDRRYVPFRGKIGERIRLGTKVWAAIPLLLLALMTLPPFLGWNEQFGDNLANATMEGRTADVERMLNEGRDPNESLGRGRLPLQVAVQNGNREMFDLLLRRGAHVNGRPEQAGPLHYAIFAQRHEFLRWLVEKGANVNARDNTGDTALSLAAKRGDVESLRYLLAHGADAASRNDEGETALDHARRLGHVEAVKILEGR